MRPCHAGRQHGCRKRLEYRLSGDNDRGGVTLPSVYDFDRGFILTPCRGAGRMINCSEPIDATNVYIGERNSAL